ncbi:DUF4007 family protein [Myxococcota bacterium]|nr:DUF4007 family protein [Myxococcota bacterium]
MEPLQKGSEMQFGGHETFPIREGWLYKGLKALKEAPDVLYSPEASDMLGLGRNMVKSLHHWLISTGLQDDAPSVKPSLLGELIWDADPFFNLDGTWWAIHINLVTAAKHAAVWSWFFDTFHEKRFEKSTALEQWKRSLDLQGEKERSSQTLARDLGCLLQSYSTVLPPPNTDPEENLTSPLADLGLLTHYKESGFYRRTPSPQPPPPELFFYALEASGLLSQEELPFASLVTTRFAPSSLFQMTRELLYEWLLSIHQTYEKELSVVDLASEKGIRFKSKPPLSWLKLYYKRASL